jgi:hypothetical protein
MTDALQPDEVLGPGLINRTEVAIAGMSGVARI